MERICSYHRRTEKITLFLAITMFSYLILFSLFSFGMSLPSPLHKISENYAKEPHSKANATTCPTCLLVKSSFNIQNSFPWLFNNPNTKFFYSKTDSRGWPIYQYISSTTQTPSSSTARQTAEGG